MKSPLIKITFLFILGIISAFYLKIVPIKTILLVVFSTLFFIWNYFFAKKNIIQKPYFGLATYILSFCIGMTTQTLHVEHYQKNHFLPRLKHHKELPVLSLTIHEKFKETRFYDRYVAQVTKWNDIPLHGKILLSIRKDSLTKPDNITIGTSLQCYGMIVPHKKAKNSAEFDYKLYLENKSIYGQVHTSKDQLQISPIMYKDIWYYSALLRERIIRNLRQKGIGENELHIIVALILGQQQDISPEIMKNYQYAGAVHILSVSGLHVGFIIFFIQLLLKFLPNNKSGRLTKLLITLFSLWLFAVIAGLSPSVVRAVTMFSFVTIGRFLNRDASIYNTLTASLFLILLFKPSFLFEVGFQLSYIAVFSIVWLQPIFSKLWNPKHIIGNYFWNILTVSFAAQIGAFPLSLYYFHQFPGLFFITNLAVIPFLTLILALGVFVTTTAFFHWIPLVSLKLLEYSIFLLNKIIGWIASFEHLVFKEIAFNFYMMITYYLFIITLIIWYKNPRFKELVFVLGSIISFQLTLYYTKWQNETTNDFIVFHVNKKSLIAKREGTHILLFDQDHLIQKELENSAIKTYLQNNFINTITSKPIQNVLYFDKHKILVLDKTTCYPKNIEPDILIITQTPQINLERVLSEIKTKIVIADGSNYQNDKALWHKTCLKKGISFYDTTKKGSYILRK